MCNPMCYSVILSHIKYENSTVICIFCIMMLMQSTIWNLLKCFLINNLLVLKEEINLTKTYN